MLIDLEFVGVLGGGVNETEDVAERQTIGDIENTFVLFSRDFVISKVWCFSKYRRLRDE
jgi:hypothetical protein